MWMGVVGMLMALFAVADESEDRTLDLSTSTSDKDDEPFFPRRRENARLNELRNYTIRVYMCTPPIHTHTHIRIHTHTHTVTIRQCTYTDCASVCRITQNVMEGFRCDSMYK